MKLCAARLINFSKLVDNQYVYTELYKIAEKKSSSRKRLNN